MRIYEYVRNEITSEWYAGSQKGAVGTLRDGSGNDVDQASLLIALFRASQLAARYVHGVVELTVEAVADDLGLSDPAAVPDALARAGVAYTPMIRGGRVAAVQVEHTWVDAYLPYSNYRGAVVDYSGRTWLPLAPAVASYEWVEPSGILRAMDLQVDAVLSDYLAAPQPIDLLTQLRDEVEAYLTQNAPGESYEEQLGRRSVVRQELGLLPSSLPMTVVAITGEAPALADEQVVKARFVVRSGVDETSAMVLDGTVALSELSGRRVTLSYIPATVDDHATVNAFGGLLHVPVYLVRVRPAPEDQRPAGGGGHGLAGDGGGTPPGGGASRVRSAASGCPRRWSPAPTTPWVSECRGSRRVTAAGAGRRRSGRHREARGPAAEPDRAEPERAVERGRRRAGGSARGRGAASRCLRW